MTKEEKRYQSGVEYRRKNKEKLREGKKEHYYSNRDKILKQKSEYYVRNREKLIRKKDLYIKTIDGYFTVTYGQQRARSKRKGWEMPTYSKEDLRNKYKFTGKFLILFWDWCNSGYEIDLKPSFDRINSKKPYTLDNIQLMTWEQNNAKGRLEAFKKSVIQYDLDGKYIREFDSATQASKELNCNKTTIAKCCSGVNKTSQGFKWSYK